MILITKNTLASKVFIFVLSSLLVLMVIIYLFFGSHNVMDVLIGGSISIINIAIAWNLSFNDYAMWLDTDKKEVVLKRRKEVIRYSLTDFNRFHLEYCGVYLSNMFRFYRLRLGNKKYRVRYYTPRLDTFKDLLNYDEALKIMEEDIKQRIVV